MALIIMDEMYCMTLLKDGSNMAIEEGDPLM